MMRKQGKQAGDLRHLHHPGGNLVCRYLAENVDGAVGLLLQIQRVLPAYVISLPET
ncbi:hypothetical protein D3C73_1635070 [compost metagenome]